MSRRGQISIDRIVALRSSVLPFYILIQPDGSVMTADEVNEDGSDFLTTRMHGDGMISFQSIRGDYLSAVGGQICTRRYCSADERFFVEKLDTQYAFRARSGTYLSILDCAPFVTLAQAPGETEMFQLFSLMMNGVNVGKQLETLERSGTLLIEGLLTNEEVDTLRAEVIENSNVAPNGHETRVTGLVGSSVGFARLATHPVIMQLARRMFSPKLKLSDVESCRVDADHVRKELEATTWHVVHPYSAVEFPGLVDGRVSFTATWFLDKLDEANSTWAYVQPPLKEGSHLPQLPQLSSPEEVEEIVKSAKRLTATCGSAWLYLGPVWMSSNVGAASFWKDYDAQTRYKHLSGQKEQKDQSFRALTDAQRGAQPREELCPTVIQTTYIREYVAPQSAAPVMQHAAVSGLEDRERALLEALLP